MKNTCNEVKYALISSKLLKTSASLFRLKRDGKSLETKEYLENLCSYLDSVRQCKTITLNDLLNTFHGIAAKAGITSTVQVKEGFIVGEHIDALWYVGRKYVSRLGVVDGVDPEYVEVLLSYTLHRE